MEQQRWGRVDLPVNINININIIVQWMECKMSVNTGRNRRARQRRQRAALQIVTTIDSIDVNINSPPILLDFITEQAL